MFVYLSAICCILVAQVSSQPMNKYEPEKRLYYLSMPMARYLAEVESMRQNLGNVNDELRQKRFEGLNDYMEDANSKRTSLKRLAILSARGFGKK
ncbi:hypothetical protein KIN20_003356 [Parelaphostrongylus tenuis]|uniref:Uncharacterized protein n=1 Tax=Parelaphostrongylus tenuis TaxID=148309 RepID=A0AAD5MFK1_PARTN|nr:hypothetical protein KIN20_003356 [Parelaphostrongylus tenuis]